MALAHDKSLLRCIGGALKEAYLSLFILFFKMSFGQWPAKSKANAHTGVLGIAIVENFLLLSVFLGLQIETEKRIELQRWAIGVGLTLPIILNYYFLIIRRHGIIFEKKFNTFDKGKRMTLLSVAVAIILTIAAIMIFVGITYRRMFLGIS
jgi:hypothetical protein